MRYPGGIQLTTKKEKADIRYENRGMDLEYDLNLANAYYRDLNVAYIYKKPTPIQVTKVDYKKGKIVEAYFKEPSTTDYNGIYQGKYIDFEAKETNLKTGFPLKNIHKHQIEHLAHIVSQGGIGFLIVRFQKLGKTFLLFAADLFEFIDGNTSSRIPYSYFLEHGYLLEEKYHPRIDYLKVVSQYGGVSSGTEKTNG